MAAPFGTDVAHAAAILRRGGVVAFPTETVYGLGADPRQASAVDRVYAIKGRPRNHPLIVHVHEAAEVAQWAAVVTPAATLLMSAFWPGPLTLLLPKADAAPDAAFIESSSVAVRMPNHAMALALIAQAGGAVAAPSANRFGALSPTSAADVAADLGDDVDYILDGGRCEVGVESTIVSLLGDQPVMVRPGGITRAQLEALVGQMGGAPATGLRAPGLLPSHYAPRARLLAVWSRDLSAACEAHVAQCLAEGRAPRYGLLVRNSDDVAGLRANGSSPLQIIALSDDVALLARHLYEALRSLDDAGVDTIIAVMPDAVGVGEAVVDRLQKASGPRDFVKGKMP
ncbi:MAG: threonylcarbamoyl-AMP synthase [Myxococcales bacterium]|nr:threonylcarbamoyl-AMP synthase [Myxococcales bacterium]